VSFCTSEDEPAAGAGVDEPDGDADELAEAAACSLARRLFRIFCTGSERQIIQAIKTLYTFSIFRREGCGRIVRVHRWQQETN
jgi:hypothetical protein